MRIALDARKLTHADSGIGSYTRNLVQALLEEDKDLELGLICGRGRGHLGLKDARISEVHFPFPPISPYTRYALGPVLRRHHFDVVHSPFDVVPRGLRTPLVVTIHDINWLVNPRYNAPHPVFGPLADVYYRRNLAASLHEAQRILAVSYSTRKAICAYAPWHDAKVRVTYNGLDPSRIYPLAPEVAFRLLAPWLAPGTPFVLTVGQGAPYKNHLHAVRGFLEAFGTHPTYRMVLVRRTVERDRDLQALLRQPQVQKRVLVLPYITPGVLNALYNAARMVLHPSYYEGFGLPLVEAMAVGTPVVTSTVSAMPEVVGSAALLVDPADVRAIGAALQLLDRDETLRTRLIAEGRKRVALFHWRTCARATLDVYREVA